MGIELTDGQVEWFLSSIELMDRLHDDPYDYRQGDDVAVNIACELGEILKRAEVEDVGD